ncbi:MAG TPA: hypothetical protein PLR01_13955 [Bacteroidales bacterium]|nr:hypothetical protein [Bacteroidales bacterium]
MKTRAFLLVMLVMGFFALSFGQEQPVQDMKTLFKPTGKKISHGGYIGVSVGYTQMKNENVITLGGRAGWLIDHHVTIGVAGNSFISNPYIKGNFPNTDDTAFYLMGGYGGLLIEPIIAPNFPVHVSFPILIGGGGFILDDQSIFHRDSYEYGDGDYNYDYYGYYNWDSFFVVEPGVEIELNVIKFFRIGVGASYRITTNLSMDGLPKDMLNGFNAAVTFKFGKF